MSSFETILRRGVGFRGKTVDSANYLVQCSPQSASPELSREKWTPRRPPSLATFPYSFVPSFFSRRTWRRGECTLEERGNRISIVFSFGPFSQQGLQYSSFWQGKCRSPENKTSPKDSKNLLPPLAHGPWKVGCEVVTTRVIDNLPASRLSRRSLEICVIICMGFKYCFKKYDQLPHYHNMSVYDLTLFTSVQRSPMDDKISVGGGGEELYHFVPNVYQKL